MFQTRLTPPLSSLPSRYKDPSLIGTDKAVTDVLTELAFVFTQRFPLHLTIPEVLECADMCQMVPDLKHFLQKLRDSIMTYERWKQSDRSTEEEELAIGSSGQNLDMTRNPWPPLHPLLAPTRDNFPTEAFRDVHNALETEIIYPQTLSTTMPAVCQKMDTLQRALTQFTSLADSVGASTAVRMNMKSFNGGICSLRDILPSLQQAEKAWWAIAQDEGELLEPVTEWLLRAHDDSDSFAVNRMICKFTSRFWAETLSTIPDHVDKLRGDEVYREDLWRRNLRLTRPPGSPAPSTNTFTFGLCAKRLYRLAALSSLAIQRLPEELQTMTNIELYMASPQRQMRKTRGLPIILADRGRWGALGDMWSGYSGPIGGQS